MECVFCDIVNKKAEAEIIFEDTKVIAFLDIRPIHLGHILVIPKEHYIEFIDIPDDCLSQLIITARVVADAMVKSLNPDGYNLFCNNGYAAGQSVFHYHMHVTPRYFDDEIKFKINFKKYENSMMKEFAEKIKSEILIKQ